MGWLVVVDGVDFVILSANARVPGKFKDELCANDRLGIMSSLV